MTFIFSVSIIWACASILVQYLYTKESFDSPFLLTYIGVSLFTLLLPTKFALEQGKVLFAELRRKVFGPSSLRELEIGQYENVPSVPSEANDDEEGDDHDDDDEEEAGRAIECPVTTWTNVDHMRAAIKIAPVWFLANWTYNASLAYTSITSSTVLASTGSVFTFLFAVSCKDEQFTGLKAAGVLLGFMGSLLTALHDSNSTDTAELLDSLGEDDEHTPLSRLRVVRHLLAMPAIRDADWWTQDRALFGDALGLISAVGYGAYAVMVRVMCPRDESLMSMELLLGYIGLFSMTGLSPILIYQLTQGSHADLTWVVLGFLVIKGLLDNVLSDYLWARAVVLTSATVATVGLGLTIPLAFMSDVLWMGQAGDQVVSLSSVAGALSVLTGFVLVNIGADPAAEQEPENNSDAPDDNGRQPMQLTEIKVSPEREAHKAD